LGRRAQERRQQRHAGYVDKRVRKSGLGESRAEHVVRQGGLVALENSEAQARRRASVGRALGELERFEALQDRRARAAEKHRAALVEDARAAGASWAKIGAVVGLTAEGARHRYRVAASEAVG
jgi:hypothetical protein